MTKDKTLCYNKRAVIIQGGLIMKQALLGERINCYQRVTNPKVNER